MGTRANTGKSGAGLVKQRRPSTPKGQGKASRDNGEAGGQMRQKGVAFSPQAKHLEVLPQPAGEQGKALRKKKP